MRLLGDTANNAFDVRSPSRMRDSTILGGTAVAKAFGRLSS